MEITRDGGFTFEVSSGDLARGLRPSRYSPRNEKFLVEAAGAVGYDDVLQTIQNLNDLLVDTDIIADGFPYPQIFVFTNCIIVCGSTKIYELVAGALELMLTVDVGITWSAVDFYDYVYMSNGQVAVERSATDGTYSVSDLPIASAIVNFNGQVMIGAPDVERS